MKKVFSILLFSVFLWAGEVKVAAAANLKIVFPKIIEAFHRIHPDIKIDVKYASSGKLESEIKKGVKYDIYLSANKYFPDELYGIFKKNNPKIYAKGKLTIVSHKKFNIKDVRRLLLDANCIVVANPSTAPYGKAAMEAINNLWILYNVKSKIVYAKNVADVIPHLKKCNIGIIAKSLVYALKGRNLYFLDLPSDSYYPIDQSAILLSDKKDAKEFYNFIFSKTAKKLFKEYGYME